MFEYFNVGAFLMFILISVPMLFAREKYLLVLSGLLMLLLFYNAYSTYNDVKNNIRYFKDNNNLICFSGGGLYTSANKYSVSKQEGWHRQKNYFKKESLLIRADKCELQ